MKQRLKQILALVLTASLTAPALPLPSQAQTAAADQNIIFTEEETIPVNRLGEERSTLFNTGWKFFLGESASAQDPNFNDSEWRNVDLPHDYSIEQEFTTKGEAESGFLLGGTGWYRKSFTIPADCDGKNLTLDFNGVYMNATVYVNGTKLGTHPYGYTGFAFDISDYVVCDGSTQNVIAVKVQNQVPSSRWYSGSGIYRDVYFNVTDPIHISRYGTTITTPQLETQKDGDVSVMIQTSLENEGGTAAEVQIRNTVLDSAGNPVSDPVVTDVRVGADGSQTTDQTAIVNRPSLWSPDSPVLYQVKTEVLQQDQVLDTYTSDFGFRYLAKDIDTGFYLNGEKIKLKGVCLHHDQGSLGAKAYEDAIERQVKILKEMGCNSIRVTHNPASDVLVRMCDKYGMLMIDEIFDTWLYYKNGNVNDYSLYFNQEISPDNEIIGGDSEMTWSEYDMKEMVSRGKNAPSIIMWSLGNELMEGNSGDFSSYSDIAGELIGWGKEIDDTRFYTFGDNKLKANWAEAFEISDVITAEGGMVGGNYCNNSVYNSLRNNHPDYALYGSETASALGSRGVYYTKGQDNSSLEITAYDKTAVGWGDRASSAWFDVIRNDFIAGTYVWTGFDYLGEPTPWNGTGTGSVTGGNPSPKSSYFGIVDTAGFPKDDYYLYQSLWNDDVNTLHILPCWDQENIVLTDNRAEVVVYTDAAKVELYLNGKKIDEASSAVTTTPAGYSYRLWQGKTDSTGLYPTFQVPYESGTLSAKAYDENGREITDTVGRNSVITSSSDGTRALELTASYSYGDYTAIDADGASLSYISVDVLDKNGNPDPDAADSITFTLEGNGELVGTDNGDQRDTTCYVPKTATEATRKAYNGKALAIVKSTTQGGSFTLTAEADGLEGDRITVTTTPVTGEEAPQIQSYLLSRHCYVRQGTDQIALPSTIEVTYNNGDVKDLPVTWDDLDTSKLDTVKNFMVSGTLRDENQELRVSITIHVYGTLTGAEQYSGITAPGTMPELPNVLNTYLENGYAYEEFPVDWNLADLTAESFSEIGAIVPIRGTVTTVFGESFPVQATIRVAEPEAGERVNIAPSYLELTESCSNPSDNLLSIVNGVKYSHPNAQTERWTNWNDMSDPASPEITFTWATAHLVDELRLFFYTDATASCQELSKTVEGVSFEYSLDGSTWIPVEYEETIEVIPDEMEASSDKDKVMNGRIYKLKESINPIGIRISFQHDTGKFLGLSEVEIMSTSFSYSSYSQADLSSIRVDGKEVESFDPDTLTYTLSEEFLQAPSVEADTEVNASYTILPLYGNEVKILVTSEDRSAVKLYKVIFASMDNDIKLDPIGAKADSEQTAQNPQPGSNAIDGDSSTHWHSNWSNNDVMIDPDHPENNKNNGYTIDLGSTYPVSTLKYLPRQHYGDKDDDGCENGRITKYRILYGTSEDNLKEVQLKGDGTWENDSTLKTADFTTVYARYIRIEALATFSVEANGANKYISAAEFMISRSVETPCICEISNPLFRDQQVTIPFDQEQLAVTLEATAQLQGGCLTDGHEAPTIQYTYTITEDESQTASIQNNVLTVSTPGTVKVQVTARALDNSGNVIRESSSEATIEVAKEPKPEEYTITFTGGEGVQGTAPEPIKGYSGTHITLPANTFVKENHTFTGWSDGSDIYSEGADYTIGSSDVTLTAVWDLNEIPSVKVENITGKADSEQTAQNPQPGSNAVDQDVNTHWHSNWSNNDVTINPANPDQNRNNGYTIDLGAVYEVTKLEYLPRIHVKDGDGCENGRILQYRILAGTTEDALSEVTLSGSGTWENTETLKTAKFEPVSARYLRIEALATYGDTGNNKFISAAEFYVYHKEEVEPVPDCTCSIMDLTFEDQSIVIPYNSEETTVTLAATAQLSGNCPVEGHTDSQIQFTYEIVADENQAVSKLEENTLTVHSPGAVTVKATAAVNGREASKNAEFIVSKETSKAYSLTFQGGGETSGSTPGMIQAKPGTVITLPKNTFVKEGYQFKGWNDGTKIYAENASYTVGARDITFTAVWEKLQTPAPEEQKPSGQLQTPGAPAKVSVSGNTTKTLKLSWSKVDQAAGYRVYRYNTSKKKWEQIKDTTALSYKDTKRKPATEYRYKVTAYSKSGAVIKESEFSPILKTATKPVKPSIKVRTAGKNKVKITWKKKAASRYVIYMKQGNGKYKELAKRKPKKNVYVKQLKPGKTYRFRIRSYKQVGKKKYFSAYSKSIKIKF